MRRHDEDSISPNPSNGVYPEQLQLKLYQAFIFSIPILFSIILFLLFYLFYLKRRALNMSSNQHPSISNPSSFLSPPWNLGIKGELKDMLNIVLFDEELRARDSLCCVCLGEFEMKEELRQLPFCRHVFHGDCIRNWLQANATCPLCRHPVISATRMGHPVGLGLDPTRGQGRENQAQQHQEQAQGNMTSSSNTNISTSRSEEHLVHIAEEPYFNGSNS